VIHDLVLVLAGFALGLKVAGVGVRRGWWK
jgi:hypothetical protein